MCKTQMVLETDSEVRCAAWETSFLAEMNFEDEMPLPGRRA